MKKEQIITLSVCAFGSVLLIASSLILYRGVVRFNAADRELNSAKQELLGYYSETVFPSGENVSGEKRNIEKLDAWFTDLATDLRAGNVVSTERSPSKFVGIFERARERLLRDAQAAGTELPIPREKFAFGFDRYTGTGALPKPNDVPRLTEQLVLVNRVCKLLFENRVKAIRSIERAVFEDAAMAASESTTATDAMASSGRRGARRGGAAGIADSDVPVLSMQGQSGVVPEGGLYGKYRFVFEFNAKEAALINILNELASSPTFTLVTSVTIDKDIPLLMPVQADVGSVDRAAGATVFDIAPSPVVAEEATVNLGPNYPVSGIEMEVPMRIRIELNVFKFKGDSNESGG